MISFTVPGQPVPAERPRVVGRRAFTPKRSKDYQASVAGSYCASVGDQPDGFMVSGALTLTIHFFRGDKRRCDLDNLAKNVLDGLNGVAFEDDSQIVKLTVIKSYDPENPRAEVEIIEAELDESAEDAEDLADARAALAAYKAGVLLSAARPVVLK